MKKIMWIGLLVGLVGFGWLIFKDWKLAIIIFLLMYSLKIDMIETLKKELGVD